MNRPTKTPGLPDVPAEATGGLRRFLQAMREVMEVREGLRGDSLDAAATFRALVDRGVLQVSAGKVIGVAPGAGIPGPAGPPGPQGTPGTGPTLGLTPPPGTLNLRASAGFTTIFVEWDEQIYSVGGGHDSVEVWGALYVGTGPLPTLANAVRLDRAYGLMYPFAAGFKRQWHFWSRNVSRAGVPSSTYAGGLNGVSAKTSEDPAEMHAALAGQITRSDLHASLGSRVDLIDVPATFAALRTWDFANTADGWLAVNAAVATATQSLTFTPTANDPQLYRYGLSIDGAVHNVVRARVRRASGSGTWDGACYYSNSAHGFSASFSKVISAPVDLGLWTVLEWDMSGIADWAADTITGLRLDLVGATSGDVLHIDWIAIGRRAPGTSQATVEALQQELLDETSARANAVTTLTARLNTGDISQSIAAAQTTANAAATASTANANAITTVQARTNRVVNYQVSARGYDAQLAGYGLSAGIYSETGSGLNGAGSMWSVQRLDSSTAAFVGSAAVFNTLSGSPSAEQQGIDFAAHMTGLADGTTVVIYTQDYPGLVALTASTRTAIEAQLKRMGATQAVLDRIVGRSAYILVGIAGMGEGTGVEKFAPAGTRCWIELQQQFVNGRPVGVAGAPAGASAYAAVQSEASARATETGALFAQWTVKLDVNGYVSGFGLASTAGNAAPSSSFIVRADRFAVAAPSGPGITPAVPFIVNTTTQTENGVTIPPGVYMDAAYLRNMAAAIARMGQAWIDDGKIANLSAEKLTAGTGIIGGLLRSANFNPTTNSGWVLRPDGTAQMQAAYIVGRLTANQIDGEGLRITRSGIPVLSVGNFVPNGDSGGNLIGNPSGGALNTDGWAEGGNPAWTNNATAWSPGAGNGAAVFGGATYIRFAGRDTTYGTTFPVEPGQVFYARHRSIPEGGTTSGSYCRLGLLRVEADGSVTGALMIANREGASAGNVVIEGSAAIPAGWSFARVCLFLDNAHQGTTFGYYVREMEMRRKVAADWVSRLVDSSAGLLNSQVSLGTNLLYNASFDAGLDGWGLSGAYLIGPSEGGLNLGIYALAPAGQPGNNVFWTRQIGRHPDGSAYYEYESTTIPVHGSTRYILSGYTGAHRCRVELMARVFGGDGSLLQDGVASSSNTHAEGLYGSQFLNSYKRQHGVVDTVPGAGTMRVYIRKWNTDPGEADSYLFVTRLMLEQAPKDAATPGPWAPSGLIDRTAVRSTNKISAANIGVVMENAAISDLYIGSYIQSYDYSPGTTGWRINKSGTAEFRNVLVRGDVQATSLSAATGTFSGTMTAAAVNAVNTINIAGDALTVPLVNYVSAIPYTEPYTTVRAESRTLGAITTSSAGQGKVLMWVGINGPAQVAYYQAQVTVHAGDTTDATARIRIYRNSTVIYEGQRDEAYLAATGIASTNLANLVLYDNPGPGVACTYTMELYSNSPAGACQHRMHTQNLTVVLMECKK